MANVTHCRTSQFAKILYRTIYFFGIDLHMFHTSTSLADNVTGTLRRARGPAAATR